VVTVLVVCVQLYDLRKSANKLAEAKGTPEAKAAAKSLFEDLEQVTVNTRRKDLPKATAAYEKAKVDFATFLELASP
jgi:hypothetical protein